MKTTGDQVQRSVRSADGRRRKETKVHEEKEKKVRREKEKSAHRASVQWDVVSEESKSEERKRNQGEQKQKEIKDPDLRGFGSPEQFCLR